MSRNWNAILRVAAPPMRGSVMEVELSHAPNPDYDDRGGYGSGPPAESGKRQRVPVASLDEASRVCREYLDRNELGGGNWTGGQIFKDGQQIARVSYNGRIWGMDGKVIDNGEHYRGAGQERKAYGEGQNRFPGSVKPRPDAGRHSFSEWLMDLPSYSGEVLDINEWTDPNRWPSPEAHHEAMEAADLFHAGNLGEAEREVYDAMQMANSAATRREGRRTMRGTTARPLSRKAQHDDWSALTGEPPAGGGGGGVPAELSMEVGNVMGGDDFADLLDEPGEGKSPVDLDKKEMDLVRTCLESKLEVADEHEHKMLKGLLGKLKGIGNAVLTPTDDDEEDGGAGDEHGDGGGEGGEGGGDSPIGDEKPADDGLEATDEELERG